MRPSRQVRPRTRPRPRAAAVAALAALLLILAGCGGKRAQPAAAQPAAPSASPTPSPRPARTVVRKARLALVDRSRRLRLRDGTSVPRRLDTVVRYPRVLGGTPAQRSRAYPLVVFAHGYSLSPRDYRGLLLGWAKAGFVVAAPVLPGESAGAPGGPNRGDILNQPGDLRYVIRQLRRRSRAGSGPLRGRIDGTRVAVAGHSDGGDTALAVAYDARYRMRGVDAAIILAGADLPGIAPFAFPAGGPPLLAVQGTADTVNPPADTEAFFNRAPAPKLLLSLTGADHFSPYMSARLQLRVIGRMSVAFLRRALKEAPVPWRAVARRGRQAGVSRVVARVAG